MRSRWRCGSIARSSSTIRYSRRRRALARYPIASTMSNSANGSRTSATRISGATKCRWMQAILAPLVAANIQLLPLTQIERHWVFARDGFIALVERTRENGFGQIGSSGLLTERGMAVLVARGDSHFFVAKDFEVSASADDVETLRRFSRDLT